MRKGLVVTGASVGSAIALFTSYSVAEPPTVPTEVMFNDPTEQPPEQYRLFNQIVEYVNKAEPGTRIQASLNVINEPKIEDVFIDAYKRGVHVQIVINNKPKYPIDRLVNVIGSDRTKQSWVYRCPVGTGCVSNVGEGTESDSSNHNKFILFSRLGNSQDVVLNTSMNFTPRNNFKYWNDTFTFADNPGMYRQFQKYFEDQASDSVRTDNYHYQYQHGDMRMYTGPQKQGDTMADIVRSFGGEGTTIQITSIWFDRVSMAKALKNRAKAGAKVKIYFTTRTAAAKLAAKHTNIEWNRIAPLSGTHNKILLVDGEYKGHRNVKRVWAGSMNADMASLRENDENMLRIENPNVYAAYARHLQVMQEKGVTKTIPTFQPEGVIHTTTVKPTEE